MKADLGCVAGDGTGTATSPPLPSKYNSTIDVGSSTVSIAVETDGWPKSTEDSQAFRVMVDPVTKGTA